MFEKYFCEPNDNYVLLFVKTVDIELYCMEWKI